MFCESYFQQTQFLIKIIFEATLPLSRMLLDNYDPNAVKLFSKCAKNQASKFSHKKRPNSGGQQYSSLIVYTENKKPKKTLCTFDMSQSRQQRESKSKAGLTPAVGQYNPKIQHKIKLTWDILKIYKNKTQSRKTSKNTQNVCKQELNQEKQLNENQINSQISENLANQTNTFQNQMTLDRKQIDHQKPRYFNKQGKHQNNRYKTIKSQVDMSRMTGRPESKHTMTQNDLQLQSSQLDVSKSIQYVKSKPSLNFQFQRQISRQKINSLNKQTVVPSDYSYNYCIIKPQKSAYISFQKSAGRTQDRKKQQSAYSYTHYDYDKYVWGSKSNIYSNTKTHMVDFKKQTNRVAFKR